MERIFGAALCIGATQAGFPGVRNLAKLGIQVAVKADERECAGGGGVSAYIELLVKKRWNSDWQEERENKSANGSGRHDGWRDLRTRQRKELKTM